MVTATLSNDGAAVGSLSGAPATAAVSSIVQTALIADKSIHWLLFMIGSILDKADPLSNLLESEKRFPFNYLNKVSSTDTECKDDGETDDDSDDDAAGDDSDDDAEDSSGDDDDDDDDDEEGGPDSDSDSDDNEDSDDDDDDEDSDDDDEDDDDDEEDEDEDNQPPCKKTK